MGRPILLNRVRRSLLCFLALSGAVTGQAQAQEILIQSESPRRVQTQAGNPISGATRKTFLTYRSALSDPKVRDASEAEIRRQLSHVSPVAFVKGYWITPIDMSGVYANVTVQNALRANWAGAKDSPELQSQLRPQAALALMFLPNELADLFKIPRTDLLLMLGPEVLRGKALDSFLQPQTGRATGFATGSMVEVTPEVRDWWQNPQAEKAHTRCKDKTDTGDCDGDGTPNEKDTCPFDPACSTGPEARKEGFVGCVLAACAKKGFETSFNKELLLLIEEIAADIRQANQMGQVLPLGPGDSSHPNISLAFPE
jgi:hypothetical protein